MPNKNTEFVLWFDKVNMQDVALVGGKNASLGEMYSNLTKAGINVPNGFAVTAHAYRHFLKKAGLEQSIINVLKGLDTHNIRDLKNRGKTVRQMILKAEIPKEITNDIRTAYTQLGKFYNQPNPDVAVRSSATAEDLPGASFAGQQETFLNVRGIDQTLWAVKGAIASLFTDRAISYRADKGFSHIGTALSVAVQKMVRSDLASSGVAFTLDTETGFDKVVIINSIYGLGEFIVQGKVIPDEFVVFKPGLEKKVASPIIANNMGKKNIKLIYAKDSTKTVKVSPHDQKKYSLTDKEVVQLAKWCVEIEKHFSKKYRQHQPMDIEWAKDGRSGELFIVQARPETVHSISDKNVHREWVLSQKGEVRVRGTAVGSKIASGKTRVIASPQEIHKFKKGEVLVTEITDPDWEPIMKIAAAIVTDKGGRTSHAAIVSRELGIPAIVGTENATEILKPGETVTIDCSSGDSGIVYKGELKFRVIEHRLDKVPETKTNLMVNIGSPDEAFKYHNLPVTGVGLGRLEFIISSHIQVHPNALIDYAKLKKKTFDKEIRQIVKKIDDLAPNYEDKKQYYIDELAEGIAKIGASFYPRKVIVRFSDFKTNEYRTLVGGGLYEPHEENPMIGWRGASRYYHPKFAEAFKLECLALKKVRDKMGLGNVIPMIPFCRTIEEGRQTLEIMKKAGLKPKSLYKNDKQAMPVYVMCEIPSNILLADEFLKIFDGISIGSNDLTQLTLGLDRDSEIVNEIGNEKNPAVKKLIREVIDIANRQKKYNGICGQAPSDYPDFAEFLVELGIDSISVTPDTVIKTKLIIAKKEQNLSRSKRRQRK